MCVCCAGLTLHEDESASQAGGREEEEEEFEDDGIARSVAEASRDAVLRLATAEKRAALLKSTRTVELLYARASAELWVTRKLHDGKRVPDLLYVPAHVHPLRVLPACVSDRVCAPPCTTPQGCVRRQT